jgi:hypothetical protein
MSQARPHAARHLQGAEPVAHPSKPSTGIPRSAALSRADLLALQGAAGNAAVQRLVRLTSPPAPAADLKPKERLAFVRSEFTVRKDRSEAYKVIEDMAVAKDVMDFSSRDELKNELLKRVIMTEVMQDSQAPDRKGRVGFGYPFTGSSLYWGPRVDFAAKDFWLPLPPDNYDLRTDPAKRKTLRELPRGQRHTVFGDQPPGYEFRLSPEGQKNPFDAIMTLFERQGPHKRTLVHCDYLVSLIHFRAFMATMGKAAFNAKIAAYGPDKVVLRFDLFSELLPSLDDGTGKSRPGLGSIDFRVPSSPADLVIGDHVMFFNHPAYDLINATVGNAWRLENAVLIARPGGQDVFLGHGSGQKTSRQMREKLAEEYNDVALIALRLVNRTASRNKTTREAAKTDLATRFPSVVKVGTVWRIQGTGMLGVAVDLPLALLRASQIPGLFDPRDPKHLFPVKGPIESE